MKYTPTEIEATKKAIAGLKEKLSDKKIEAHKKNDMREMIKILETNLTNHS